MKKYLVGALLALAIALPIAAHAQDTTQTMLNVWRVVSGYIVPNNSANGLKVPSLGSVGSPCLSVSSTGAFATTTCGSGGGSGTVTSVALTVPTGLSVTGSPVTSSSTLVVSLQAGYVIPLQSTIDALVPYTYASSTFPSFTYASSTFATIANYPTYPYASSTFVAYGYGTSTYATIANYPTYSYASNTFATLLSTPSYTYGTSTYVSFGYATSTYATIASYPAYTYASNTFATILNYPTYSYASSTYANFAYGSSTYATIASYPTYTYASNTYATILNYPTYAYASSTFVHYNYGSSTYATIANYPTYTYGSSTYALASNISGANGKVARFTSASVLSTGILFDNAAVSGVNATSSTTSFLVQGTGFNTAFRVNSSTGTSMLAVDNKGQLTLANGTNTGHTFYNPGDSRFDGLIYLNGDSPSGYLNGVLSSVGLLGSNNGGDVSVVNQIGNSLTTYDPGNGLFLSGFGYGTIGLRLDGAGFAGFNTSTSRSVVTIVASSTNSIVPILNVASTSGASYLHVNSAGHVGIGTSTQPFTLTVSGTGYISGSTTIASLGTGCVAAASGSLYIGSTSCGGSGGSASGTAGSLQFSNGSSGFNADQSALLWDNTNKYLGVGTSSPTSTLFIQSKAGTTSFVIASSAGSTLMTVSSNGNVGIATGTPQARFQVAGNLSSEGTGGTITHSGGYTIHTFTSSGSFVMGSASSTVELLIVAGGGGGGGNIGGGGGGGGRYASSSFPVSPGTYNITIGAGGAGGVGGAYGTNGSSSTFGSIIVSGGGGGGYASASGAINGKNGGSGGGCGSLIDTAVSDCTGGTGNVDGFSPSSGNRGGNVSSSARGGPGGGGAGAAGGDVSDDNPGNGGGGAASSISGASVTYAGGGGGGGYPNANGGTGGSGGGGNGGTGSPTNGTGDAGTANTGGGGGGGGGGAAPGGNGGAGGSGIVIVRYLTPGASGNGLTSTGFVVTQQGWVGVGTSSPITDLSVVGAISQSGGQNCTLSANSFGTIGCVSDEQLKDVLGVYPGGLDEIGKIDPIYFRYTGEFYTHVGFSAQNVQKAIPEATPKQTNGFLGLDINAIVATVVNAIKDLKRQLVSIALRLDSQQTRIDQQQKEIDALKLQIQLLTH